MEIEASRESPPHSSAIAPKRTVIIGAGPAGLTAAYELSKLELPAIVLEKDLLVGGLSRTVSYKGFRFDIGGHRFFTKVPAVQEIWEEILGDEFLECTRLSRIYYDDKFFDYPLRPLNALRGLGILNSIRVLSSYVAARVAPYRNEENFEQWVSNRFGRRLYEIFFRTYTEKVWGMPCTEISADWASQRIKNLDLLKAIRNAVLGDRNRSGEIITTLIDKFHYPRHGPGMMWEHCQALLEKRGIQTVLGTEVVRLRHDGGLVLSATVRDREGREWEEAGDHFIVSMPLSACVRALAPAAPDDVQEAAKRLRYRDFLTVVLIVDRAEVFPDNWIYIHSPKVRVGRVQNFKNWSSDMVPDSGSTALGLEYFVHEGDDLWSASDSALLALGAAEMETLGLLATGEVIDGTVVRTKKAYPVYDGQYRQAVASIRSFLSTLRNLQVIGRNGQHRYNNQDHSMLAGVYAARNIAGEDNDLWSVNVEPDYHEERRDRLVPAAAHQKSVDDLLLQVFARYDPVALGIAVGLVSGVGLFLATVTMVVKGGEFGQPTLSLLGNYLLGYRASWTGAFLGLFEGGVGGYLLGHALARAVNFLVGLYETSLRRRLQLAEALDPLEMQTRRG